AGSIAERTRAIVNAGCDMVLHCNGKLDEMREIARETPELTGQALERAKHALATRKSPEPFDRQAARAELDALIDRVGTACPRGLYRSKRDGRPSAERASRRSWATSGATGVRSSGRGRWRGRRRSVW